MTSYVECIIACRSDDSSRNGRSKRMEELNCAITVGGDSGLCHSYLSCSCSRDHCPTALVTGRSSSVMNNSIHSDKDLFISRHDRQYT